MAKPVGCIKQDMLNVGKSCQGHMPGGCAHVIYLALHVIVGQNMRVMSAAPSQAVADLNSVKLQWSLPFKQDKPCLRCSGH